MKDAIKVHYIIFAKSQNNRWHSPLYWQSLSMTSPSLALSFYWKHQNMCNRIGLCGQKDEMQSADSGFKVKHFRFMQHSAICIIARPMTKLEFSGNEQVEVIKYSEFSIWHCFSFILDENEDMDSE